MLPARNEAALLGGTVEAIREGLLERGRDFEVIIVENGSSDETAAIAGDLVSTHAGIRLIRRPEADYGAALAAGFAAARGVFVASFDVDYFDLGFLDVALALLETDRVSLVVASKRAEGAHDRRPVARRVLTAGFTAILRLLFGLSLTDAHGMKVFRRAPLAPIIAECVMRASLFDVEMVLRAGRSGLAMAEVPAEVSELRPPRSGVLARSLQTVGGLVRLRFVLARGAPLAGAIGRARTRPARSPVSRRRSRLDP